MGTFAVVNRYTVHGHALRHGPPELYSYASLYIAIHRYTLYSYTSLYRKQALLMRQSLSVIFVVVELYGLTGKPGNLHGFLCGPQLLFRCRDLALLRWSPTPVQPRANAHEGLRHPPACEAKLPHALASTSAVDAVRGPASYSWTCAPSRASPLRCSCWTTRWAGLRCHPACRGPGPLPVACTRRSIRSRQLNGRLLECPSRARCHPQLLRCGPAREALRDGHARMLLAERGSVRGPPRRWRSGRARLLLYVYPMWAQGSLLPRLLELATPDLALPSVRGGR